MSRDEEFTTFVSERSARLLLVARALCGDAQLAEDLVQSALEKAYVNWGRLREGEDPFFYVRRILVNVNATRARRRRFREIDFEHSGLEPVVEDEAHWAQVAAINQLLAGLSERERAVVVLRHLEDLSEAETAEQLGIPLGSVKSASHRALAKLRASSEHAIQGARHDA